MARTYRHRVSLQEPVKVQDATTGEILTFWQTVENCGAIPCEILTGPGREYKNSGTIQAEGTLRVNFRWFSGLLPTWRLVWNGKAYNIGSIELDTSARREYRLTCTGLGETIPAVPTVVSAVIGATGRALTWTFSAPLGGSGTLGFTLSGASITSGSASGSTVTQVISQVLSGSVVSGSYTTTTGTLVGYGGEVASFSDVAITNNSTVTGGLTSYPLDDDGTLATGFGFGLLTMTPPDYNEGEHVYTGTTPGGTALAFPSADRWLTDQAIVVSSDKVLHIEFEPIVPSCYEAGVQGFPLLGLGIIMSDGGELGGVFGTVGIKDVGGTAPQYAGTLVPDNTVRATADGPVRMAVDLDGSDGSVTIRTIDGDEIVSPTTFTPGTAFTAYLFVQDGGAPLSGNVVISLVPKAADAALPCNPGAVDLLGQMV